MKEELKLTDEQQLKVLTEWNNRPNNPPSLDELVDLIFEKDGKGRTPRIRVIRAFLASRKIAVKDVPKKEIELTEEQKEFIGNNCANMTVVEMAREIFNNQTLTILTRECRLVSAYIKTLPPAMTVNRSDVEKDPEYKPPMQLTNAVARINKCIFVPLVYEKISPSEKKNAQALMGYLHTYRFVAHINTYESESDRKLFEDGFIRMCYDKPDLTEEEVDQYIIYSSEVVIGKSILRRIEMFSAKLDETMEDGNKPYMTLVEAVASLRTEHNQCIDRQRKLLTDLQGKRSERLKDKIKENASILSLVEMWKFEKTRKEMIDIAEKQKQLLKNEIEKLSTMDELKARLFGISESEILNG